MSRNDFFNQLWSFVTDKHNQGVYNTICLAVVLTLPLLVLLTAVLVCCHCCCYTATTSRLETKKKKNSSNNEDLWISVKTVPMTPDRVALTMV
uniref:KIAA0040 n=1 Tax=Oryzias melastigma TaxID=30732 RepID=A0A3B3E0I5_ORYME